VAAGRSGFVFGNRNVEQLGELVVNVLANAERRESVGAAARQWAMATFSWDAIAAQLESEYLSVLDVRGVDAPLRQRYGAQA
jgi:glycosyltransferase involved in cell wall biosynthesis